MNTLSVCPGPAALRAYLLGHTPDEAAAAVEEHLTDCPSCGRLLQTLEAEDDFVADFRAQARLPLPCNEFVDHLAEDLHGLFRLPVPAGEPATAPDTTPALNIPRNDMEDLRRLLAPPREPDEIGRLGTYRILQKLGAGGMGMVFLAEDSLLQRTIALKTMLPRLIVSPQARERFLREARAAASLEHPNVVAIYQVGEDNGVPFLAMPLLKGQSLDDRLTLEQRLPEHEALRIAAEMADGLAAAHERGLIHRDIKPANVWLEGPGGLVKLLDFGLARPEGDITPLTQLGTILGTPAFMAPEQARGEAVDGRADLFSLGCVLYLMLTGKRPFTAATTMGLLTVLAVDTPEEPHRVQAGVSVEVSEFTMRLLAKKPAERPATAQAVAEHLRCLAGPAGESRKAVRSPEKPGEQTGDRAKLATPRRWRRAGVLIATLLGTAALVAGIIIIRDKTGKPVATVEVPKDGTVDYQDKGETMRIVPLPKEDMPKGTPKLDPVTVQVGEPLFPAALVRSPAVLPGVISWTIEPIGHRSAPPWPYINPAVWSRDGKRLASADSHQTARIWNAETGALECMLVGPTGCLLGWSADGTKLIWYDGRKNGHLAFQEVSWGQIRSFQTRGNGDVTASLSPDEKTLVVAPGRVYDVQKGEEIDLLDLGTIAPGFSPDGRLLASLKKNGKEYTLHVWSANTFQSVRQFAVQQEECDYGSQRLAWSADSKFIAARNGETVAIYDVAKGTTIRTIQASGNPINKLTLSPDWSRMALVEGQPGELKVINCTKDREDNPRVFQRIAENLNVSDGLVYLTWSPDGKRLAALGGTHKLGIIDVASGRLLKVVPGHPQGNRWFMTWLTDGSALIANNGYPGHGNEVAQWELATGKRLLPPREGGMPSPNGRFTTRCDLGTSCAWSSDSTVLVTRTIEGIKLTDPVTGNELKKFEIKSGYAPPVSISPDKKRLANWGVILDVETGKKVGTFPNPGYGGPVGYSPDGKFLASVFEDGRVGILSADDLKIVKQSLIADFPNCLAWSPNGKRIATSSDALRIWTIPELGPVAALLALHDDNGLAVSAEGHFRGTPHKAVEREIVYLVQTEKGQETLTPQQFAERYHWTNDPDRVRLSAK